MFIIAQTVISTVNIEVYTKIVESEVCLFCIIKLKDRFMFNKRVNQTKYKTLLIQRKLNPKTIV